MGRRVIVCDGAELARLWARIGASESDELTWVPREDESRARPPGFRTLQGGLSVDAISRLEPEEGDEFALISADDLEMGALAAYGTLGERAAAALLAGCDQVPLCNALDQRAAVVDLVRCWSGRDARLAAALARSAGRVAGLGRVFDTARLDTNYGGQHG